MAQGIMTGIGFLGAGVIFKEGLTVRGLTTAASIWVTASIGVLVGIGFWIPALFGTIAGAHACTLPATETTAIGLDELLTRAAAL